MKILLITTGATFATCEYFLSYPIHLSCYATNILPLLWKWWCFNFSTWSLPIHGKMVSILMRLTSTLWCTFRYSKWWNLTSKSWVNHYLARSLRFCASSIFPLWPGELRYFLSFSPTGLAPWYVLRRMIYTLPITDCLMRLLFLVMEPHLPIPLPENEANLTRCCTSLELSIYWTRSGLVGLDGELMSKSLDYCAYLIAATDNVHVAALLSSLISTLYRPDMGLRAVLSIHVRWGLILSIQFIKVFLDQLAVWSLLSHQSHF